ncbi:hypothetical protein LOTGIDRAFT_236948 [Lottia gigantea]|uniref:CARD domain-containing protein n=1 Tax=Lottia gigantea TaxID=225164 RepID=V4B2H0_LOTGI|nr:hypothetical protein LOTGIDRAFT_236948 [Lottia gigantea]ESO82569.1 hypothetical protein LOTGIDRAFT_236948 [Lottia gigantea]
MAMTREKREVIQKNFTKLTENIEDIDRVVSNLLSAGVITTNMEEEIMAKTTKRNKIRELLNLLPKRGQVAFDKFYTALIDSEENVAAEFIEPHVINRSLVGSRLENQVTNPENNRDELPAVFPPDQEEEVVVVPFSDADSVMTANYHKSLEVNNDEVYKNTKGLYLSAIVYKNTKGLYLSAIVYKNAKGLYLSVIVYKNAKGLYLSAIVYKNTKGLYLSAIVYKNTEGLCLSVIVYKNTKGRCLIICNENFDDVTRLCDLDWEKDVGNLMTLFEKLRFSVDIIKNCTVQDLKKRLDRDKQKDMKDVDCLVVFVLTYGENGQQVYGTDGTSMTIQSIVDYFYPTSCPGLSTKPKLFFIQTVPRDLEGMDSTDGTPEQGEISLKKGVNKIQIGQSETSDSDVEARNMPSRGDTYLCVSATSDKVKPDESDSGSMFILALVYAYKNYSYSNELGKLTLKMNALIKKGEIKNGRPVTIGSSVVSSLAKSLYFFPKNCP